MTTDRTKVTVSPKHHDKGEILDMHDGRWEVVESRPLQNNPDQFAVTIRPHSDPPVAGA